MDACGGELELCACSKPRGQSTQPCICIAGSGQGLEVSKESGFEMLIDSCVDSLCLWRAEEQWLATVWYMGVRHATSTSHGRHLQAVIAFCGNCIEHGLTLIKSAKMVDLTPTE